MSASTKPARKEISQEDVSKVKSDKKFTGNPDLAVLLKALSRGRDFGMGINLQQVDPWAPNAGDSNYWYGDASSKATAAMLDLEALKLLTYVSSSNSDGGVSQSITLTPLGRAVADSTDVSVPEAKVDPTALIGVSEIRENVNDEGTQVVRWKRG